ncbi:PKD domain-containing protein, partial [Saccharicrinis sp. 156]|uniref:PKD domain-containing protein n=1 Tax=Saccharicrinis sp. 156 TaxID=3417574 RepID=UPI003D3468BB
MNKSNLLLVCMFVLSVNAIGQTADFNANNTTVCTVNSVVFTNASTGGVGIVTYTWNFGAGATPSNLIGEGPHEVTYIGSGPSTVTLTMRDTDGEYVETKTNYITRVAAPTINLATGSSSQSVCPGTAITDITYNIANATGATVTGVAGLSGSYNSGVFTVTGTPTESGTYTVT